MTHCFQLPTTVLSFRDEPNAALADGLSKGANTDGWKDSDLKDQMLRMTRHVTLWRQRLARPRLFILGFQPFPAFIPVCRRP